MRASFRFRLVSVVACGFALTGAAVAQSAMDHSPMGHVLMASSTVNRMSEGEVKKIDPKAQTVTIKHGEIKNLGMGAMTMTFKAKSADLLTRVKVGDKVRFKAEMVKDALTVSAIERAP
jgi:Cu/Ag efflux protein CusF